MRILLVQDTDWLERNTHQQHHVLERLRLRGHDITVIDHDLLWRTDNGRHLISKRQVFRSLSKAVDNADIMVFRPRIVKLPLFDYVSMLFTYTREIAAQFRKSPPDVVIGMYLLSNYLALRAARRHGTPFIFHVLEPYNKMIPFKPFRSLGKLIERTLFTKADHTVVINEGLKDYAIRMGAHLDKVSVISAGVDYSRFGAHVDNLKVRRQYRIKEHDTVLFFMGWLYPFAGIQELLIGLAAHMNELSNVKVLIVGDGDAFEELVRLRKDLDLDHDVILAGKQPYDVIPEFIAASDICLLPAHNNAIMRDIVPIKMYEYMAMGKPVIATKLPGVVKEFGTDNGVVYIERPKDALCKAMKLVNAGTATAHGEKARKFVQQKSWDAIVNQFEDVLVSCVRATHAKSAHEKTEPIP